MLRNVGAWVTLKKVQLGSTIRNIFSYSSRLRNKECVPDPKCVAPQPKYFILQPSRFSWNKLKDSFHFYVFIGLIPVTVVITCANIFIGPATLAEIPDDYVPQHWEYYRSPITRFLAQYCYTSPQQEYEKLLHTVFEESEKMELRKLEDKVKNLMAVRRDYVGYYYRPAFAAKYVRVSKEAAEYLKSIRGD